MTNVTQSKMIVTLPLGCIMQNGQHETLK